MDRRLRPGHGRGDCLLGVVVLFVQIGALCSNNPWHDKPRRRFSSSARRYREPFKHCATSACGDRG